MIVCDKHHKEEGEDNNENNVEIEILLFVEIFKMFEIRLFDGHFPLYCYTVKQKI